MRRCRPPSMPACVAPRGSSRSFKGNLVLTMFFWPFGTFCSSGRGCFLVLSAPWHAGSPPEHQGASVGPGRRPWHVLWGFEVARPHGEAFRARRAIHAPANARIKECPTAHVISGTLNVIYVIRHYLLGDGKVFLRHHARYATTFNTRR